MTLKLQKHNPETLGEVKKGIIPDVAILSQNKFEERYPKRGITDTH